MTNGAYCWPRVRGELRGRTTSKTYHFQNKREYEAWCARLCYMKLVEKTPAFPTLPKDCKELWEKEKKSSTDIKEDKAKWAKKWLDKGTK